MILSIWRYAHLALALISSVFMLILSITGVILAIDAVNQSTPAYQVENFESLNLAQTIPNLRKVYPEIIELNINHNHFVIIDAIDEEGNSVKGYVDPNDGKIIGIIQEPNAFIQWTTALHRSLFLKETGRIIVAVVSFILFLITISGFVLILKRQQGLKNFFSKINKDFFAQYFHVVSGRLFLIPIIIIALTGTYLFMARLDFMKISNEELDYELADEPQDQKQIAAFKIFQETPLSSVEKIEFPFMEDDPEEFYTLKLKERTVVVNQINGEVIKESKYPYSIALEKLSLDLHTGRTNIIWAIILGLASLNIVFFIYTGFVITFKRTKTKIKNKYKAEQAEIIILVGSENGSTLFFANQIHKQLLADGKRSFLAYLNQYRSFPQAKQLLIFSSTYGLGTAPTSGSNFEELIKKYPQQQEIAYAVVAFGSKSYADYCAFAHKIDQLLVDLPWTTRFLEIHEVNDKSTAEFLKWVHHYSEKAQIALATAPTLYEEKVIGLKKFTVVRKTSTTADNLTFSLVLKPHSKIKFQSGDLLAIYPANDARERFYSIARKDNNIQLEVKLHEQGLGSSYLYALSPTDMIHARVLENTAFHFPEAAPAVIMIANGTGIAPFLGMIAENKSRKPTYLYTGFRYNNSLAQAYSLFADEQIALQHLQKVHIAFSREQQASYVMDLIQKDAAFFADHLNKGGYIMVCGSLSMLKDVEKTIHDCTMRYQHKSIEYYKENGKILSDCY